MTMWQRIKPWIRRWLGLAINGLSLLFFAFVALLEFAGTNVNWQEILGAERAKIIVPLILGTNVVLRVLVTRTRGSPED